MVSTALVDEAVDNALDVVGLSVGQSCLRTDSEDALPVLLEERSVMSCLVRPDAVLISQDFRDDRFSPGVCNRISLVCQVDLDSLWMVYWEGRRSIGTGSRTGVSAWRSVLCGAARFSDIGRDCVLDLNAWGTCPRVRLPDCGLETFAQMPPIQQNCLISEVLSGAVAPVLGCVRETDIPRARHRMRGKWVLPRVRWSADSDYIKPETVVGSPVYGWLVIGPLGVTPGETQDARKASVSPGEFACAEDSGYIRPKTVVNFVSD